MKIVYKYNKDTKLLDLGHPSFEVADDFECPEGMTEKAPITNLRARYLIKWNGENWNYVKRDHILWTSITDTPAHKERANYYTAAVRYYLKIHQSKLSDEELKDYVMDENPDDLIYFLENNLDAEMEPEEYTLEDTIKWIKAYEQKKQL